MDCKIILNRLEHIVDRYSTDTGFSFHMQPIAGYFSTLQYKLEILNRYAHPNNKTEYSENNLSGDILLIVCNAEKEIDKTVKELIADKDVEKYVKKYRSVIDRVVEAKNELVARIKENNSIKTSFEATAAEMFLDDMRKIPKNIERDYSYLESLANSQISSFLVYHIESDDFLLLADLRNAKKLSDKIENITPPQNDEELQGIQLKAKTLYNKIAKTVIDHYDTLVQLDTKYHQDDHFIRKPVLTELQDYRESEADDEPELV